MSSHNVHPITDEALGNTSYLVAVGDGEAISIDPRRDVADHLDLAARMGLRIVATLETHLHADFVSGSREIASATAAEIVAAKDANLGFAHRPVAAQDRLEFAGASIEVLATPGHTPEHLAYHLRNGHERAVFSGGSLIVGGAARTDLTGADRTDQLARAQFESMLSLATLPDDTTLYPTHGGGSFCSTTKARSTTSTIGEERATNPLLAARDEDEFVAILRAGFGTYPTYFSHLREVNHEGAALVAALPEVGNLSADDAWKAITGGARLIDARPIETWARAHAPEAVSIELRPAFASWLGWVVPFGAPIVLMLEAHQLEEAVRLARRIGYDAITGWISFDAWHEAGFPVSAIDEVDAERAEQMTKNRVVFLDVRQAAEFASGHIAGATHVELGDIIGGKTPGAESVITYCGHGERSATAASLLAQRGLKVANLHGGTAGWRTAGYDFEP